MMYGTAAKFLLAHPGRAITIANHAGNDYFDSRPDYLGSYPEGSNPVHARHQDYSLVADVGRQFSGMGIAPLLLMWAALGAGAVLLLRRSDAGTIRRGFATAALLLIGFSVVQFFTASFGEAVENTKHMIYGILAGALAPVFLLTGAIGTHKAITQSAHEPSSTPQRCE